MRTVGPVSPTWSSAASDIAGKFRHWIGGFDMMHDGSDLGRRAAFGCLAVVILLAVAAGLFGVVFLWDVNGVD
jgi:hypothetical protein